MAPARRARLSPPRRWVKAMGMHTVLGHRARRKAQVDRRRRRPLVATGVVLVAVDLAAAVLALAAMGVVAAVGVAVVAGVAVDDLN